MISFDLIWFDMIEYKQNTWLSWNFHDPPIAGIQILACFRSFAKAYLQLAPLVDISFARHRVKHVFVSPRRIWRWNAREISEIFLRYFWEMREIGAARRRGTHGISKTRFLQMRRLMNWCVFRLRRLCGCEKRRRPGDAGTWWSRPGYSLSHCRTRSCNSCIAKISADDFCNILHL